MAEPSAELDAYLKILPAPVLTTPACMHVKWNSAQSHTAGEITTVQQLQFQLWWICATKSRSHQKVLFASSKSQTTTSLKTNWSLIFHSTIPILNCKPIHSRTLIKHSLILLEGQFSMHAQKCFIHNEFDSYIFQSSCYIAWGTINLLFTFLSPICNNHVETTQFKEKIVS